MSSDFDELLSAKLGSLVNGICTHYVVLAEVLDTSGEFFFVRVDDGDTREWLYKGLIEQAKDAIYIDTRDIDKDE